MAWLLANILFSKEISSWEQPRVVLLPSHISLVEIMKENKTKQKKNNPDFSPSGCFSHQYVNRISRLHQESPECVWFHFYRNQELLCVSLMFTDNYRFVRHHTSTTAPLLHGAAEGSAAEKLGVIDYCANGHLVLVARRHRAVVFTPKPIAWK